MKGMVCVCWFMQKSWFRRENEENKQFSAPNFFSFSHWTFANNWVNKEVNFVFAFQFNKKKLREKKKLTSYFFECKRHFATYTPFQKTPIGLKVFTSISYIGSEQTPSFRQVSFFAEIYVQNNFWFDSVLPTSHIREEEEGKKSHSVRSLLAVNVQTIGSRFFFILFEISETLCNTFAFYTNTMWKASSFQ